jgi:D-serine dehydratase
MPIVQGKTIEQWRAEQPVLAEVIACRETWWCNPAIIDATMALAATGLSSTDIDDATRRLDRFAPCITRLFPETAATGGLIESPLLPIPAMQRRLADSSTIVPGRLLLKCDHLLPVSGSIKARGGIYEVLKYAETLALTHNLLSREDDYARLATPARRQFFGTYRIAVGSTGNLGLSIGIIGAALGFAVTVHMSADARTWKKTLLRSHGVQVIEYQGDYGAAVAAGRDQAAADPFCHFIDDENSLDLLLGYATAGARLAGQLAAMDITVDAAHPLVVYLPCGVGGGPGGVTLGLKYIFGDHVHCIFAEPTHSPCMLLGLATGLHDRVTVQDFGLDNRTGADGLAVARPSGLVGRMLAPLITGVATVDDDTLYRLLAKLADSEQIFMEPSALAGMAAMTRLATSTGHGGWRTVEGKECEPTHVVWGTGGSMVPPAEMTAYYRRGAELLRRDAEKAR